MRGLIYSIVLAVIFSILIGCKAKTIYVPVESSNTQKEQKDREIKDSIRFIEKTVTKDSVVYRDSVVYKFNENGDLVSKEIYQWRDRYRESNHLLKLLQSKYDSLLHIKRDSIRVEIPYPVEVVKEVNRLKPWQIILMCLGCVLIGFVGYRIVRFIK